MSDLSSAHTSVTDLSVRGQCEVAIGRLGVEGGGAKAAHTGARHEVVLGHIASRGNQNGTVVHSDAAVARKQGRGEDS